MEELLKRAAAADALSYEHLHILLDALPVAVSWAKLPGGDIQFVNRTFKNLFGYNDGEFATADDWIERSYPREIDRLKARERWNRLWANHSTDILEIDAFDIEVLCADRTVKTVQHRGILLPAIGVAVAIFDDISQRRLMEDALRRIAFEDTVTGLPNRRALQQYWADWVATKRSAGESAALLLLDLDGFKSINDRFGHDVGDAALLEVASRMRNSVNTTDFVCRIGGDEFVVFLPGLREPQQAQRACWRILSEFSLPWSALECRIGLQASIGISIFPQDGSNLRDLLKCADTALYRAKATHRGGCEWFRVPDAA
ncbi:sensor domain-containing diguanylate cyclase [Xanthobacter tagetidis]|uniref:Sensor domain-containing diguanylate cyclase n=1 Tax=Xanthobacter tagetidis TaxID=60216 RepID=A0A3L7AK09_9HYPH|nr:sensor domain-containing diguanylate cyclase [Xanthobacter tagetidis]MBB6308889.1 diguanylate cyclase (GGDEF)-like protein [Xanthobacter tagetidis]RLP80597.1 sensor domain-containing diguanylate cyclase [Xanthobacter tagetidis]